MIEALLFLPDYQAELVAASDMIDQYEGSIPPAATFQVIDLESTEPARLEGVA